MLKNRKLFWGFLFQERTELFLQQFFVMLEMSKDGMTGFLLMVEVEKINIENNFIEYDQTQGRRVYPVQMS